MTEFSRSLQGIAEELRQTGKLVRAAIAEFESAVGKSSKSDGGTENRQ